jgi:hypothetical protein
VYSYISLYCKVIEVWRWVATFSDQLNYPISLIAGHVTIKSRAYAATGVVEMHLRSLVQLIAVLVKIIVHFVLS